MRPWFIANTTNTITRDSLIRFWLAAPEDLLPSLWESPLGEVTKTLVRQLTTQTSLSQNELELRDALGQRLTIGLDKPGSVQLLLAIFLLSPIGQFRIETPDRWLPTWLIDSYRSLYDETNSININVEETQQPEYSADIPKPDFGNFPRTLRELTGNRIQLNRMLGLANLYYIDPEDLEILHEFQELRVQLASAIERCPEDELEDIWSTDFGDRYWAVVRSGIQKESNSPADMVHKQQATEILTPSMGGGFNAKNANNAFLISMLYYIPGEMKVNDAENKLPAWILAGYKEVFEKPLIQPK